MKLKNKIFLLLILVMSVSLGIGGVIMQGLVKDHVHQSVAASLDAIARNSASTIYNFLDFSRRDADAIAMNFPLDALLAEDVPQVERYLSRMYANFTMFKNGLYVLSPNGELIVDWPPEIEKRGGNYADTSYFKRTAANGRGVVGGPFLSDRSQEPVITLTSVLRDKSGNFLGVLCCSAQLLDPQGLGALRLRSIGAQGYIYIFDSSRTMVLHPDEGRILKQDVQPGDNHLFDRAIEGFQGVEETVEASGVPVLTAMRQVYGTTWIVAAQQPLSEALYQADVFARQILWVLVTVALLASLLGGWSAWRMMRPLTQIEQAVSRLEKPREDQTKDDLRTLGALDDLRDLKKDAEFGELCRVVEQFYLGLCEALVESRTVSNELKVAKEDVTQALDAAWHLTEELEEKNIQLKASHRDLELAHEQLKSVQCQILQQEKMASIGQLAAGVAHEINNPIGFITSNLGTLRKYVDKIAACIDDQEKALELGDIEQIRQEVREARSRQKLSVVLADLPDLIAESLEGAERVKTIVQNLKTFSRVDQDGRKEVDLHECLESTIKIAWNEIKYKAELVRDFGELPLVFCNAQELNQVFLNLLVNSAQAIESQGEIRVRTWGDDSSVHVQVADSGCGMTPEVQQRIFEPFFTTKPVGKGTGLGMSIAWDIVKKHGGVIDLQSKVGEGSVFTISLPLVSSDPVVSTQQVQQGAV